MATARRNKQQWRRLVDEFERSDERQSDFARRLGINVDTFRKWLYRIHAERGALVAAPPRMVELTTGTDPPVVSTFEPPCRVRVGSIAVDFPRAPSPRWLTELAAAAGDRRC